MLQSNQSLVSKEHFQSVLEVEETVLPTLAEGDVYISSSNGSARLIATQLTQFGELCANSTEIAQAKSRQQAKASPEPVYDINTGEKHTYRNGTWSVEDSSSLWSDFTIGVILFNENTKKSYFFIDRNFVMPL